MSIVTRHPDATTSDVRHRPNEGLFVVLSSAAGVTVVPMPNRPRLVIGRAPECDLVIHDDSVSRRHAVLDGRVLEDLGSRNGTIVKGRRLEPGDREGLDVGVVVEIGSATMMLHRGPVAPGATASAASTGDVQPGAGAHADEGPLLVDPTMRRLYAMLEVVAASDLPILVLGETGTGKEVFASQVHARSGRAGGPYLRLNCAALSGSLLESELFGHERGAFTGAMQAKPGLFEAADGGTVFLDEVGELPLETQAKLLRVLENGEVIRLGSVKPKRVNVRYVSATNRDLSHAIQAQTFRSDLFFRLNGIAVTLPPLRRRPLEVLPLAERFVRLSASRVGRPAPALTDSAKQGLVNYSWPGNIRELKSVVERAFVLAAGGHALGLEHLLLPEDGGLEPASVRERRSHASATGSPSGGLVTATPAMGMPVLGPTFEGESSLGRPLRPDEAFERDRVLEALQRTGGNQTEAAKLLSVSRRTLINKMEKYGLQRPRKR